MSGVLGNPQASQAKAARVPLQSLRDFRLGFGVSGLALQGDFRSFLLKAHLGWPDATWNSDSVI